MNSPFHQGMNLRKLERQLRRMGASIRATGGDHIAYHPIAGSSGKYNCRRKDSTRHLVSWASALESRLTRESRAPIHRHRKQKGA